MPDEFSQYQRKPSEDEFESFKRKTGPAGGAGGSWEPEGIVNKGLRLATTPLIPETDAEKMVHSGLDKGVTLKTAGHPVREGIRTFVGGASADAMETLRSFTSPIGIATIGAGELAKVPGAVGKLATAGARLAGLGFGAQGAVQAGKGAYDASKHGITPANAREMLSGSGQALLGSGVGGKPVESYMTERLPLRLINQLIKPSVADVKFGKNPGRAILEEKIVGNSLPEIGDKVYDKIQEVGKSIDQTLQAPQNASKTVDLTSSLKPIDDAMVKATQAGDKALYGRLVGLKQQLTMNWGQIKGGKSIAPTGPRALQMNPYDAVKFKRLVGDATKWTGNDPFEEQLNAVKGQIYGDIKGKINKAVPEVASLNERYSNLVGAGKAIERRIPVAERNAHWSLSDIALGATGHIPLAIARKVMSGPALKTRVARGLNSLAPN